MMVRWIFPIVVVVSAFVGSAPLRAQTLIESYTALLSERDHFNSIGERLTTAAAIIRQDRANFHRFALRDRADEGDHYFADADNRATLERMLERGRAQPGVLRRIVNDIVTIHVEIFHGDNGDYVHVTVLD